MDDTLIPAIKTFIRDHPPPELPAGAMLSVEDFRRLGFTPRALFPVASTSQIAKAEAEIGFPLPQLLKRLFLEISNGIAGFGYRIMGLEGGCSSDSETLVQEYIGFKTGPYKGSETWGEYKTGPWKAGLLPFCDWGCRIFSCVDCADSAHHIFTYEDLGVWPERYTLSEFFEMWLKGKVLFSDENVEVETKEGINPFTKERMTFTARRRVPRT
jgi:hypothetical protein